MFTIYIPSKGRPEVFDLKGAAAYLGVLTLQLKTVAKSGRMTYARIDRRRWRFARRDLDTYIARNTFKAKTVFSYPHKS